MLKKVLIGVGVLFAIGILCWTTDVGSYAWTAFKETKAFAKQQVPIEFEIKRARDMLGSLDKLDDKLVSTMATEIVAKKKLEREVSEAEVALASFRDDLRTRNEKLKTLTVSKEGSGRDQFAQDLERRFKRFKTAEATLKAKKELLAQHEERLAAAKEQREGLKGQKADLASRIEALETQVAVLKAAEARTKCRIDDGQLTELARVKELVDSLEQRIDTSMTELQLREEIRSGTQPTSAPAIHSNTSLTQEIDDYLGEGDRIASEK
jgi:chromosome segregation ATPase